MPEGAKVTQDRPLTLNVTLPQGADHVGRHGLGVRVEGGPRPHVARHVRDPLHLRTVLLLRRVTDRTELPSTSK
jgi:hypothetical protein